MSQPSSISPLRLFTRRIASFRDDRSGVTAVEFAFIAGPLLMLVFAIMETAMVLVAGMLLDNAVHTVSRDVLTGKMQDSDINQQKFEASICDLTLIMDCGRLSVDMRTFPAFDAIPRSLPFKLGNVDSSEFCFDPGSAESITVIRAAYEWPWTAAFLQRIASETDGNAIIYSVAAFMNEPFGKQRSEHANCN